MFKKLIACLTLMLTIILPYSYANANITQQLYYGSTGSQVTELQQDLKSLGYFSSTIDGKYGNMTYTSVKNFQSAKGITPTGGLDFNTLYSLNRTLSNIPNTVYYGMRNQRVSELQTYLIGLGYLNSSATGYFGTLTKASLIKFQMNNNLTANGIADSSTFNKIFSAIDAKFTPYKTYTRYTVVSGDTIWSVSQKFNITMDDLKSANNFTSDYFSIGQVIKISNIVIPVKPTYYKFGECLDWFSEAQYVLPIGKNATVIDFFSGKSFNIKRTIGSGHADCETLTPNDTAIMKEIFGGQWSWEFRPVIIVVNRRRIAASMAGMPHAGLDAYSADINVYNRSDDYGYGPNYDYIKGNNMDGHFDIHFLGSRRHKDWQIDPRHQEMIMLSSGRK